MNDEYTIVSIPTGQNCVAYVVTPKQLGEWLVKKEIEYAKVLEVPAYSDTEVGALGIRFEGEEHLTILVIKGRAYTIKDPDLILEPTFFARKVRDMVSMGGEVVSVGSYPENIFVVAILLDGTITYVGTD